MGNKFDSPKGFDQGKAIQKVSLSHEIVMDIMLARPMASLAELQKATGYTPGWLSRMIASDIFQARLKDRRQELTDPIIRSSLMERLKAVGIRSCEALLDKMDHDKNIPYKVALEGAQLAVKLAGIEVAARRPQPIPAGHVPVFNLTLTQQVAPTGLPLMLSGPETVTVNGEIVK